MADPSNLSTFEALLRLRLSGDKELRNLESAEFLLQGMSIYDLVRYDNGIRAAIRGDVDRQIDQEVSMSAILDEYAPFKRLALRLVDLLTPKEGGQILKGKLDSLFPVR